MRKAFKSILENHPSFCYFILFGICGVLVDVDHAIQVFLPVGTGRAWHPALIIMCGFCVCFIGAFVCGLFIKVVLSENY